MHHENHTVDDRADAAQVVTRAGLNHFLPKSDVDIRQTGAGESVGDNRLTLLAQFEGDDKRWSAQAHASPRLARLGS
jgi:hypothetical protein